MNEKFLTQAIEQAFDCVHKNKEVRLNIVQDGKVRQGMQRRIRSHGTCRSDGHPRCLP